MSKNLSIAFVNMELIKRQLRKRSLKQDKKRKPIKNGKITFILSEDYVAPATHIRYHITAMLAVH
jgi:hypothetical protein